MVNNNILERVKLAYLGEKLSQRDVAKKLDITYMQARYIIEDKLKISRTKVEAHQIAVGRYHPLLGRKLSSEHRKHISEGNEGRFVSIETRQRISGSLIGHFVSSDTRDRIGEVSRKIWANRTMEEKEKHLEKTFNNPQSREKIKRHWATLDYNQRQERMDKGCHSPQARGKQRQYLASLTKEQLRERMKPAVTASRSPEVLLRRGKTFVERYRSGVYGVRFPPARYKGIKTTTGVIVKSLWEATICNFLTELNIKWLYEPEIFDLGFANYKPDLFLPEFDLWVEIKGWWRNNGLKKVCAFAKLYPLLLIDQSVYREILKCPEVITDILTARKLFGEYQREASLVI